MTDRGEFVNNVPSTGAAGLLEVLPSQGHGTRVTLASDPTFVKAYRGNNGANEPMLTCDYNGAANMSMGIPTPGYPGLQYGGPAYRLRRGGKPFSTFRCIETYSDSSERERWGMGLRKRTRLLAPQSSETPQFVHLTNASAAGFRKMVDQMVIVGGFDMLIFSFGKSISALLVCLSEYLSERIAAWFQARVSTSKKPRPRISPRLRQTWSTFSGQQICHLNPSICP